MRVAAAKNLPREVRAPHGTTLQTACWQIEAPLRMLMNSLDPDVAGNSAGFVVNGAIGSAVRDWVSFDRLVSCLRRLRADQTLLVQSGKPVGVFPTHPWAPRVLIANANLVPHWSTADHFRELDRLGLMMSGQTTAGSWSHIGSQGAVQGAYETFEEIARQHFDGDLRVRWILSAGLGDAGGSQPLAARMNGAAILVIECRQDRIDARLRTGYPDVQASDLADALRRIDAAHDLVDGYLPAGWDVSRWETVRRTDPAGVAAAARASIVAHVRAMLSFHDEGAVVFDGGNNIRQMAFEGGLRRDRLLDACGNGGRCGRYRGRDPSARTGPLERPGQRRDAACRRRLRRGDRRGPHPRPRPALGRRGSVMRGLGADRDRCVDIA